jgi:hypothetical protein
VPDRLREIKRRRADQVSTGSGKERRCSRYPGYLAHDARGMEAKGPISQHRDEMQQDATDAEAGKLGHHDLFNPRMGMGFGISSGFSPLSRIPSLNPRSAPPRSAPKLRSLLVPKISITIRSTISQWPMLNEPI